LPQQGPTVGFHNGNYVPTEAELKSTFSNVGETLNLKENQVVVN